MSKRRHKTSRRRNSMSGKCYDCGGRKHPFAIYEWEGPPRLRDALCPVHGTQLIRVTGDRCGVETKFVSPKKRLRIAESLPVFSMHRTGQP